MKKTTPYFLGFAFCAIIALPISSLIASSSNPPVGNSGSPGDGRNCTACHSTFAARDVQDVISSNIPDDGYVPGETYTITVANIEETGFVRYGMQLVAEDAFDMKTGTFIQSTGTNVNGDYIRHTTALTSQTPSWTFEWTAPEAGTGQVTFHGAFVAGNASAGSGGDIVKLSSLAVNEQTSTSTSLITDDEFKAYVNGKNLVLELPNSVTNPTLTFTNLRGQVIVTKGLNNTRGTALNVNLPTGLANGIYFVTLNGHENSFTQKINIQ